MFRAVFVVTAILFAASGASQAQAFEYSKRAYSNLLNQTQDRAMEPASYRIVTDKSRTPARISGSSRYFGGEIRIVYVDGRAVKMPESVIIENVRQGHFVPVYESTGAPLSREDWIVSLPTWLGFATVEAAR